MSLNQIKAMKSQKGFTIVELLIVIVIIGILAAIVIVAYNGVTNRAKASKTQSTVANILKKAEAYNAENGTYPTTLATLTGAASSTTWYVPTNAALLMTSDPTTAPSNETSIRLYTCDSGAGVKVGYWNYESNSFVGLTTTPATTQSAGVVTGTCVAAAS